MEPGTYSGFELALTPSELGIVTITFDRPERLNALTYALKRDLVEVLLQMEMDDRCRVVVFTGAGRAFIAGDDIVTTRPGQVAKPTLVPQTPIGHTNGVTTYTALRSLSQALTSAVRSMGKPTVAAINGHCIQSGLSLALACDFRIAASTAVLGSGTLRFAMLPDEGGHFLLLQHVGLARTLEILLRRRMLSAPEALEMGLVNEVVEPDELLPTALALAAELAEGPQVAIRLLKRACYNAAELTFAQALDDIALRTAITDHHPDAVAGTLAFARKSTPRFNEWLSPNPEPS